MVLDRSSLMQLLSYNAETGEFRWLASRKGRIAGEIAGGLDKDGYWLIQTDGQNYRGHRLAWLFVYGEWPTSLLDHKNRKKSDNRIGNLRLATYSQNLFNTNPVRDNSSGVLGVSWCKQTGRWKAQIAGEGRVLNLGRYATIEEAKSARIAAEIKYAGEFRPARQVENT